MRITSIDKLRKIFAGVYIGVYFLLRIVEIIMLAKTDAELDDEVRIHLSIIAWCIYLPCMLYCEYATYRFKQENPTWSPPLLKKIKKMPIFVIILIDVLCYAGLLLMYLHNCRMLF